MASLIDAAFQAWLRDAITAKGYDRLWITNNMASLEQRFAENPAPMEHCPVRVKRYDRYEEL
jgi:hypothetical protein